MGTTSRGWRTPEATDRPDIALIVGNLARDANADVAELAGTVAANDTARRQDVANLNREMSTVKTTAASTAAFTAAQAARAALAAEEAKALQIKSAAPTDAVLASVLGNPASATRVALDSQVRTSLDPVARKANTGQGSVVLTMDDAFVAMARVAQMMNARGQRGTFCITPGLMGPGKITDADIQAMDAAGHEIAAHSQTHANMSSITQAQRVVEYDTPKAYLEDLVGHPVTTWAYPFGTGSGGRNTQCDVDIYLRYDRLLDTASGTQNILYPKYDRWPPFLINRNAWSETNHLQIMAAVRRAATSAVIVPIFFHNIDTPINPTLAMVTELLDYCYANDIPLVTTAEAFPNPRTVINAGFELPATPGEPVPGWRWAKAGTGGVECVTEAPAPYLPGTKSLHLFTTDTASYSYVTQEFQVVPGVTYTLSFRARAVSGGFITSAKCFSRLRAKDYGQAIIPTAEVKGPAPITGQTTWEKYTVDWTAPANARSVLVDLVLDSPANGARVAFDHVWFENKSLGDLG